LNDSDDGFHSFSRVALCNVADFELTPFHSISDDYIDYDVEAIFGRQHEV
jgi:hypothetical protein